MATVDETRQKNHIPAAPNLRALLGPEKFSNTLLELIDSLEDEDCPPYIPLFGRYCSEQKGGKTEAELGPLRKKLANAMISEIQSFHSLPHNRQMLLQLLMNHMEYVNEPVPDSQATSQPQRKAKSKRTPLSQALLSLFRR